MGSTELKVKAKSCRSGRERKKPREILNFWVLYSLPQFFSTKESQFLTR